MKRYRRLIRSLIGAIVCYYVVASITWFGSGREWYPLFPWDLFSKPPNLVSDYGLRILAVNGQALDNPAYFEALPQLFPGAQSIVAQSVIQDLGRAVSEENTAEVERLTRLLVEQHFGNPGSVRMEVVFRTWQPLDRIRNNAFLVENAFWVIDWPQS